MQPVLVEERTHCPRGHDLQVYGYYFGTNQRCGLCNRRKTSHVPEQPVGKRINEECAEARDRGTSSHYAALRMVSRIGRTSTESLLPPRKGEK